MDITPFTPLLRVSPTTIPPYFLLCLFGSLEASFGNDMVLPSSAVNPRMTRHGLRPRYVAGTLAIIACSATGFQATKPLAQCKLGKFRGLTPSLTLWLTIHLSLSLAYLVTSIHIKFRSGLAANLWPGWIVQLTHNSFAWRTDSFARHCSACSRLRSVGWVDSASFLVGCSGPSFGVAAM